VIRAASRADSYGWAVRIPRNRETKCGETARLRQPFQRTGGRLVRIQTMLK